jgi:hypothetical protein
VEAICSSETSVGTQRTTRRYIPEYCTLHNHRCKNLKFYILLTYFNNPNRTFGVTSFNLQVRCEIVLFQQEIITLVQPGYLSRYSDQSKDWIAKVYGLSSPRGDKIFLRSPRRSDRVSDPYSLLSNCYRLLFPRRQSGRVVKLITLLHLETRGTIFPLLYTSSWSGALLKTEIILEMYLSVILRVWNIFISFRHHNWWCGHTIHSSFLTCFGSLSNHQVFDIFTFTCIRLLLFLHWPMLT